MSPPYQQLPHTLKETHFEDLGPMYRGKVRDVYDWGDTLAIVATDRVSAFDRVLGTIPFKGQLLTTMAAHGFNNTADVAPNHVVSIPDPNVMIARRCQPFPVEFVVRAYVTGSLWRDLKTDRASVYEVDIPNRVRKDEALPSPILTPSTKAQDGRHDEPTSKQAILREARMTQDQWDQAEAMAFALFRRGTELARSRGLILVDTKYEMGVDPSGQLMVIDEIHTPDSSRYWFQESYQQRFEKGQPQQMLDKENLRAWLLDRGYAGDGPPPVLPDELRVQLFSKYRVAYETLTGQSFATEIGAIEDRVEAALREARSNLHYE